jgi:hypothetical protein
VYLMLLMQFLENKVAVELTRSEFVEAQEVGGWCLQYYCLSCSVCFSPPTPLSLSLSENVEKRVWALWGGWYLGTRPSIFQDYLSICLI